VFRRLTPAGLRWRLAGWVALVTLVCAGIIFVAVYGGTGTQLRHEIDQEIAGESGALVQDLADADSRTPVELSEEAERYVHDPRFGASPTLLFVAIRGAPTSTNRPELFGAGNEVKESQAAQRRENQLTGELLADTTGYTTLELPDGGELRVLKTRVHIRHLTATIGVGEPLTAVSHAQAGVARAFILAGILALAGALFASYLLGIRVSRPLRRMAGLAARVDGGDLHPRFEHVEHEGEEVRVLADAFNHMLDRLTAAFAAQGDFVADASHELRTPLTVMRGQLEVLAAQPHPSGEEVHRVARLVQGEIARVTRMVDDLLLLTRSEHTKFLEIGWIDLRPYVEELWDGTTLIAPRHFELGPVPAGTLRADPDRLAQALRNLLANAVEHTATDGGLVRMSVEELPGERLRFSVEDDGPGISREHRERVFDRFYRVDTARDRASGGAGLGLAIVRAIAEAHGGRVRALSSTRGGALIELDLPGFTRTVDDAPAPAQHAEPARSDEGATTGSR
jgi:signal transduction histidine kinase